MSHVIIITTPPSSGGGGSRVSNPDGLSVDVTYTPPHDVTPEQQSRAIQIIERLSEKFYDKLQARLADPDGGDE